MISGNREQEAGLGTVTAAFTVSGGSYVIPDNAGIPGKIIQWGKKFAKIWMPPETVVSVKVLGSFHFLLPTLLHSSGCYTSLKKTLLVRIVPTRIYIIFF